MALPAQQATCQGFMCMYCHILYIANVAACCLRVMLVSAWTGSSQVCAWNII